MFLGQSETDAERQAEQADLAARQAVRERGEPAVRAEVAAEIARGVPWKRATLRVAGRSRTPRLGKGAVSVVQHLTADLDVPAVTAPAAGRFDAFNDDELAAIHRGVDLIPSPAAQSLAEEVYQARLVRVAR